MTTSFARTRCALRLMISIATILGLSHLAQARVRRNGGANYTASYSVTCTGGNTSDSKSGITPRVSFTAPGGIGCNAGTMALAERVVGTGEIVERARAVRGDKASAGDFGINVTGVLPDASAELTMLPTDVSSTETDFKIKWMGDLGSAAEIQWFDLNTGDALASPLNLNGGSNESLTVPIVDMSGIDAIGFDVELDVASVNSPTPEPGTLFLLGSAMLTGAVSLRKTMRSPS